MTFFGYKIQFLILITFFFIYKSSISKPLIIQSKSVKQDTNKVKELNELAWDLKLKRPDSSLIIQKEALDLALALKWTKGEAQAHHQFGTIYSMIRDYNNSINHFELALKCWELLLKSNNKSTRNVGLNGKGKTLANIGHIYKYQSDFASAIKYYLMALKIMEETSNLNGIATINSNIGSLYSEQGENEKSLEYSKKAIEFAKKTSNKELEANSLFTLARATAYLNEEKNAINYYIEVEKMYGELGNNFGLIQTYNNLSVCYSRIHDAKSEFYYLNKGLNLVRTSGNDRAIQFKGLFYLNLGIHYHNDKNETELAIKYLDSSKVIADKLNDLGISYRIAKMYSECYKSLSNYEKAYIYYKKYNLLYDSLNSMDSKKKQLQIEMDYQYDKKQALSKAEFDKKQALAEIEIEKNQFLLESKKKEMALLENENKLKELTLSNNKAELKQRQTEAEAQQKSIELLNKAKLLDKAELTAKKNQQYFLYGGLIVVLFFCGVIFNRLKISNKQKKLIDQQRAFLEEQKDLISEKHKEITDSINYAERIQRSFLATKELLDENLNDYFVFFQPKDVVSGDFYWASNLSNHTFAIVTADSTGHGVPGAIMSLLNITSLESAIKDGCVNPAEILNSTRSKIIDRLKKDGSLEGGKDGMDASLICFDFNNNRFTYAAANNPIWIVRDEKLIELKPDKMPIGKHNRDSESFLEHDYTMQKGDVVYTLTDGMPDQFGGPKGKKFMYKQLKELLVSISKDSMETQKQKLTDSLNIWKGDMEQVDDITLIGIKV